MEVAIGHQMAMLSGYKSAISEGIQNMLAGLDPGADEEPTGLKALFAKQSRHFIEAYRALADEDKGVLEQRLFRPGFRKGYRSAQGQNHNKTNTA
jgi:hypothetical protein